METLRVNFYTWAAETLGEEGKGGEATVELPLPPSGTLRGLLEALAGRYPVFGREVYDAETAQLTPRVTVFLNGRSLNPDEALQTKLRDGDVLALAPVAEGG